jgi:mono/diheme cytochrome c family protein
MKKHILAIVLIAMGVSGLMILDFYSPYGYSIKSTDFKSNGERIYFTATSDSGNPIIASTEQMTMHNGMMRCAACHGSDGKGGAGRMMMWSFEAPDIRYSTLIVGHDEEQPYTDDLIKRAIMKGIDSDGKRLELPMPVWQMSEADLNDLLEFLRTLK